MNKISIAEKIFELTADSSDSEDYDGEAERLQKLETEIQNCTCSAFAPAGGLSYGMTYDQMEKAIKYKFEQLKERGQLLKEKEFTESSERDRFYPPEDHAQRTNLTRIWGANFLNEQLQEHPTLKAAKHFLIIDEGATELEVQVWLSDYPTLCTLKNGKILSEKIEGSRSAHHSEHSGELRTHHFVDFRDPGNLIKDTDGISWVVDTELNSFDPPNYRHSNYWRDRFVALTDADSYPLYFTFTIPLD